MFKSYQKFNLTSGTKILINSNNKDYQTDPIQKKTNPNKYTDPYKLKMQSSPIPL